MKKPILKRLIRYMKPYLPILTGAFVSAVINVLLTLYGPILVGHAIDQILGAGKVDFEALLPILVQLLLTVVGSALFQWVQAYCTNKSAYETVRDLRIQTYRKINTLPLSYIDAHSHGDIISRLVNDVDQVSDGLLQGTTQFFTGIVTILGTLLFMLSISPAIALAVVLITPLSIFVAAMIARLCHKQFIRQQAAQGELTGFVEEHISGQKIVKTFAFEKRAQETFEAINGRLYESGVKAQFYSSLSNPSTRFVNNLVYAAVAILGSVCVITGMPAALTVGQVQSFLAYANQYTKPFNDVTAVITQIQTAFASARRLFDFLDEAEETSDSPAAAVLHGAAGQVDVNNLGFSYSKESRLIENLSFHAEPGSHIAIVGPTGCGKTTIINLLMRFYDADRGTILIDGKDVRTVTRASLRGVFGMVLQDSWLFSGTVRENIAYGRPNASLEQVTAAAKAAHVHSFIMRLPQGYDTVIREDGSNFSQGQRQLLCIARVMLVDPPIFILDEATSSIDTRTEVHIQHAFDRMIQGRTSFIVAHRLSTIQNADCILVMNQGHIVEQGTHTELLRKNGFYAKLYKSQFAGAQI
ncbi:MULTISPECIES: ABC transporter ATP-binding protein [Caproicibacterium]|uniref:ABC transporter ATP-binding protein n=1 Tax=Caproicibacterium argilliputei TaxID=3030016 RepID=A0AA97D8D2_9FIRM|nr:ABC transporter ATP-binding protein [Caproicibacterium argilliputei]WOC31169.1 ABC transporter ATP-binding protein [Caproicibacterium argilliputei]